MWLTFQVRVNSFRIILSNFHLFTWKFQFVFLNTRLIFYVQMQHVFPSHSSIDGHLVCFHSLPVVNTAEVNINEQICISDLMKKSSFTVDDNYQRCIAGADEDNRYCYMLSAKWDFFIIGLHPEVWWPFQYSGVERLWETGEVDDYKDMFFFFSNRRRQLHMWAQSDFEVFHNTNAKLSQQQQ